MAACTVAKDVATDVSTLAKTNGGAYVEDPYADPEQTYISDMVDKDLVDNLLDKLSDKQSEVLRRRYGIGKEGNVETLRELGDMFDLTRERIRQIEVDALEKLRNVYDENGESRLAVNINI